MTSPAGATQTGHHSAIEHLACAKDAVESTLAAICGSTPAYIGSGRFEGTDERVVGVVSLVGDVAWSLMLGFPRDTATSIAFTFACFDIPFDSNDMSDVIGELTNVLAGDVVARLDSVGVTASLSLPTVARGCELDLRSPTGAKSEVMRFSCTEGPLWLEVAAIQPGSTGPDASEE